MADAGRVIAGSAKGTRLRAPGPGTRPLADRVKQTLFAIVEPDIAGAAVLDLFAGSGAAGIEALSRGAASATFVENDAGAVATIRANAQAAAVADRAEIVRDDVLRWLGRGGLDRRFDVVVVDPPYAETELLAQTLVALGGPVAPLAEDARVVAKHFWRDRPAERVGMLAAERDRRFGETSLTFYRRTEADDERMPVDTSSTPESS
jgi:16S rRNA (guanine966-N2)-methyltransferase